MIKRGFELKKVCIIIVITAIVTSLTTGLIIYNNSKIILGSTSIKEDEALTEFLRVYNSLDENYYTDYNKTEMIDAAIAAMLDYLGEDYSTYLNQDETDSLSNKLSGKYLGIGISIAANRHKGIRAALCSIRQFWRQGIPEMIFCTVRTGMS